MFNWLGALGLLLVGFRLLGYMDWSWWLVLSPFWIMGALWLMMFFMLTLTAIAVVKEKKGRKE